MLPTSLAQLSPSKAPATARTTFSFDTEAQDTLEWLIENLDVSRRELFSRMAAILDELGSDTRAELIAVYCATPETGGEGQRKTYVIEKSAIGLFNRVANAAKIDRDRLVAGMLRAMKESTVKALETKERALEQAVEALLEWISTCYEFNSRLEALLGADHAIVSRFGYIEMFSENLYQAAKGELKQGTSVDPDDYSQS